MNLQIVKNPNTGKFGIFAHDIESFLIEDLDQDQVATWIGHFAAECAQDTIDALALGEQPYGPNALTYKELLSLEEQVQEFKEEQDPILDKDQPKAS